MELEKNPFYILSATSRDGRRRLMELTEERSLLFDEEECRDAYSVLTNPRKRLSAEIAWFPGVRPAKIEELLSLAESSPEKILDEESLPSLARANILAEGITRLSAVDASTLSSWLIAIDEAFDYTDAEDVLSLLNSERVVAGFPEISEVSLIEEELENCRNSYRSAIKTALDKLPSRELIRAVTSAVEEATCDGILGINEVLIDTVDLYEVEAQEFLTKEEENIDRLIEMIRTALKNSASDTQLHSLVEHLKQVVKNWDMVAQPIQLSAKSRGLDHDASKRVGGNIRGLAIDVFNDYNKLEISQHLTALIQEVFAEVDTLAERAAEDAEQLEVISEQRIFEASLRPIKELCIEVIEYTDKNPSSAEIKIKQLIQRAPQMIKKLEDDISNEHSELISMMKDEIALAILSCAITHGNHTKKWIVCLEFITEAKKYATSQPVISRIDYNISIARENINNYSELIPIESAPTLWTINASGFTLYGCDDYHRHNNSYIAIYYFVFFGIPIFPIARYRVINTFENSYKFLGKLPLRMFDKIHIAVSMFIIFVIIMSCS